MTRAGRAETQHPRRARASKEIPGSTPRALLDRGWVLAVHILVPLYISNLLTLFILPQGGFSRGAVLRFIIGWPALPISLAIWVLTYIITVGWHERGHYIKAVQATTLNKRYIGDAQAMLSAPFLRQLIWHLKIIVLSPLGRFPGIKREGLTYYVDAPSNLAVAAEGPRASRKLGSVSLLLAGLFIPLGLARDSFILINFGRLFFTVGVVGMLDFFFADSGKYWAFRQREREARRRAKGKEVGDFRKVMPEIKNRMVETRMQRVVLRNGTIFLVPWGIRGVAQGGRITERQFPESNLSLADVMFIPLTPGNYEEAQEIIVKLQTRLHQIIENTDGCRVYGISFVGGLAPHIEPEEGDIVPEQRLLRMCKQAIEECGYRPGVDVALGIDCKAEALEKAYQRWSNTENVGQYHFWRAEGAEPITREELFEIYRKAVENDNIPIILLQDPFSVGDTGGWALLMREFGDDMFIVGDDNAPTNDRAIEQMAREGLINAVFSAAQIFLGVPEQATPLSACVVPHRGALVHLTVELSYLPSQRLKALHL